MCPSAQNLPLGIFPGTLDPQSFVDGLYWAIVSPLPGVLFLAHPSKTYKITVVLISGPRHLSKKKLSIRELVGLVQMSQGVRNTAESAPRGSGPALSPIHSMVA